MTIKSGPAKFIKLARKLISTANIRPFLRVARNFSEADELPAEDGLRLTGRALWESIPSYASHLERQHQLRAGLYSSGGFSRPPGGRGLVSGGLFSPFQFDVKHKVE